MKTQLSFNKINLPVESDELVKWLTADEWPFHRQPKLTTEKVIKMIQGGSFNEPAQQTFWINDTLSKHIGIVRLFDLDDIGQGSPLFDLRIAKRFRGNNYGSQAVKWLTEYLFESYPVLRRIEGTTRSDNMAMMRVFEKNLYLKEGHYRKAWPSENENVFDAIHYAILREDWLSGTITKIK